jgi:hypothetical protein
MTKQVTPPLTAPPQNPRPDHDILEERKRAERKREGERERYDAMRQAKEKKQGKTPSTFVRGFVWGLEDS